MRIELNSGGLGGSAVISGFQTDFSSLISKSRRVVSSFQVVKTFSNHMNGGIGSLQNAVDQIDARMQQEEAKADALKTAQKKSEDFLELVHTIDEKVSILVNRNKHDFYNKNPWAKPPQEDKIKEYYDKAKNYVCKNIEKLKEGLKNIAKTIIKLNINFIDTLSKAWDWIKEHAGSILKLAIAALVVVCLVAIAVIFPGTIAAFIAIMGLVGAGTKAVVETVKTVSEKGVDNTTFDDVADSIFKGTIKGTASGISNGIGLYAGPGWRAVAGEFFQTGANILINETDYFIDNGTLEGSQDEVLKGIADGTVDNVFDSAFFALGFRIKGNGAIKDVPKALSYIKKNTIKEIMSKNIDNIVWSAFGDISNIYLNNALKKLLNIPDRNEYDDNNIITLKINGGGIGESLEDTLKETAKMWLKRFTVTPRVVT